MTAQPNAVLPIPEGATTVMPWIISRDTAKLLEFMKQALSAGAVTVTEMTSLSWGDRGGRVRDPLGNIWWIQSRIEQVDQEEIAKRATEQQYLDARRSTRESLDRAMRSGNT